MGNALTAKIPDPAVRQAWLTILRLPGIKYRVAYLLLG
ncbi:hypothetical protein FORC88_2955 [Salmonella enterica subsp. enterica serovar Typhimurium]|nr:hypothetical protein FORC88_2955 [Salmonella enterica subsp. enterica serovar Typhimurium]